MLPVTAIFSSRRRFIFPPDFLRRAADAPRFARRGAQKERSHAEAESRRTRAHERALLFFIFR
jgi:hypothetical protein